MKLKLIALTCLALLTGCASGPSNYQLYADTQAKIAQAHAVADTARYNAPLEIAKHGDSAAKVAAVLSIQMGQGGGAARPQQMIAAPEDWDTKLLKWAGVVVPAAMQGLAIKKDEIVALITNKIKARTAFLRCCFTTKHKIKYRINGASK